MKFADLKVVDPICRYLFINIMKLCKDEKYIIMMMCNCVWNIIVVVIVVVKIKYEHFAILSDLKNCQFVPRIVIFIFVYVANLRISPKIIPMSHRNT